MISKDAATPDWHKRAAAAGRLVARHRGGGLLRSGRDRVRHLHRDRIAGARRRQR